MTGVRDGGRETEREGESAEVNSEFKEKNNYFSDVGENCIKMCRWMGMEGVERDKEEVKNTGSEEGRDSSGD